MGGAPSPIYYPIVQAAQSLMPQADPATAAPAPAPAPVAAVEAPKPPPPVTPPKAAQVAGRGSQTPGGGDGFGGGRQATVLTGGSLVGSQTTKKTLLGQ